MISEQYAEHEQMKIEGFLHATGWKNSTEYEHTYVGYDFDEFTVVLPPGGGWDLLENDGTGLYAWVTRGTTEEALKVAIRKAFSTVMVSYVVECEMPKRMTPEQVKQWKVNMVPVIKRQLEFATKQFELKGGVKFTVTEVAK